MARPHWPLRTDFSRYSPSVEGLWSCVRTFLSALLRESVAGVFQNHDERAVRLLATKISLGKRGAWREVTEAVDGIGFVASVVGCIEDALDEGKSLRLSEAEMLL